MSIRPNPSRPNAPRRLRARRGGALIEAALVLPILLALSFGMVEFGYFFFVKHTLQAAAREGARAGIVPSGTNQQVASAVASSMQAAGLDTVAYEVDVRHGSSDAAMNAGTAAARTPVKVVVRCNWSAIHSGLRPLGLVGDGTVVKGAAVMMKE